MNSRTCSVENFRLMLSCVPTNIEGSVFRLHLAKGSQAVDFFCCLGSTAKGRNMSIMGHRCTFSSSASCKKAATAIDSTLLLPPFCGQPTTCMLLFTLLIITKGESMVTGILKGTGYMIFQQDKHESVDKLYPILG